jgi:ankyrin repeat protein
MKTHSLFSRLGHSPIPRCAAVLLVALALSCLASCGRNDVGGSEIHDAAKAGDLEKVKALLKDHPDLVFNKDNDGRSPLHWAASHGHKNVVELLLANKAEANAKDNNGGTPLLYATAGGRKDTAALLLANKAEVNATDKGGFTPLHWAASMGHKDMAELLLTNKAEVNAKNNLGMTPLHYATAGGYNVGFQAVAELLRQHGGHE